MRVPPPSIVSFRLNELRMFVLPATTARAVTTCINDLQQVYTLWLTLLRQHLTVGGKEVDRQCEPLSEYELRLRRLPEPAITPQETP